MRSLRERLSQTTCSSTAPAAVLPWFLLPCQTSALLEEQSHKGYIASCASTRPVFPAPSPAMRVCISADFYSWSKTLRSMSGMDYHAMDSTISPLPSPGKAVAGLVGLGVAVVLGWASSRLLLRFSSNDSSPGDLHAFVPKQGVDKVLLRPGIPSPFSLIPPSIFGPSAFFVYSDLFLNNPEFMAGSSIEDAWVYGAELPPSPTGATGPCAKFTGKPGDVVKGKLVTWTGPAFKGKLELADELMQYDVSPPHEMMSLSPEKELSMDEFFSLSGADLGNKGELTRVVVSAVKQNGNSAKAYMYYKTLSGDSSISQNQPQAATVKKKERWDELALKKVAEQMWKYRGQDLPSFADPPGPGQESVWLYPRPPAILPEPEQIQVFLDGKVIADTRKAYKILETAHPPTYYIPIQDINMNYFEPTSGSSFCEWKGSAKYYKLKDGQGVISWVYPEPHSSLYQQIANHMAIYIDRQGITAQVGGIKARSQGGGFYGGWVVPGVHVGPFKGDPGCPGS
eukprot:gb/GEZN01004190.1/.p1 GENE.gb/GEZN01004190.1/~~gb/GEZN01004190.1/.p1  ORF type:complete len:511 (-),score=70.46 gb/GEZN01004190.1/:319-1851(-)